MPQMRINICGINLVKRVLPKTVTLISLKKSKFFYDSNNYNDNNILILL